MTDCASRLPAPYLRRACNLPVPCTQIAGTGFGVTSLGLGEGTAIAGFETGHVRIYDPGTGAMLVEVTAHLRRVCSVVLHPTKPLFLSAGEDAFTYVWTLPVPANNGKVNLAAPPLELKQGMMTGATFAGRGRSDVVASCYDEPELSKWNAVA